MKICDAIAKIEIKHHFNMIGFYNTLNKLHLLSDNKTKIVKNGELERIFRLMYGINMKIPKC